MHSKMQQPQRTLDMNFVLRKDCWKFCPKKWPSNNIRQLCFGDGATQLGQMHLQAMQTQDSTWKLWSQCKHAWSGSKELNDWPTLNEVDFCAHVHARMWIFLPVLSKTQAKRLNFSCAETAQVPSPPPRKPGLCFPLSSLGKDLVHSGKWI